MWGRVWDIEFQLLGGHSESIDLIEFHVKSIQLYLLLVFHGRIGDKNRGPGKDSNLN